jgi:hypothetical protein
MFEYGTLKLVKVILRRRVVGKRDNNGGDEPNLGTIYVYEKMSR